MESYDFPGRVTNEILHEKNLPVSEADLLAIHKLNACQRAAFKTITDAVLGNKPSAFFVDGPGGTGKTFLYRCLLAFVRSKGLIALATATSGIAASILPGGRTAHSRFKLPLTLILKKNSHVILLRNLNPCEGLCNGTRLICDMFGDHTISCIIAVGEYKGKHVLIPRIPLQPSKDENCPIPFKRCQFPIKSCFAMTINKAQGQTLDFVGLYLKEPVFSHGQLYAAMSRAKTAASLKIVICNNFDESTCTNLTKNVVYDEIIKYIL
nr:ATP-dependent DNA helicase PIF1-like [Ipomoea batatas]